MRVKQVQGVTSFSENESIVLALGPKLQEIQRTLAGRLVMLNTPEGAPPEFPRALIQSSDTIVNICLDRFDITTRPPGHVADSITEALTFAKARLDQVLSMLLTVEIQYEWSGVVSSLLFPHKGEQITALEAITPVFDRLLTIPRNNRELAVFQAQFGFKEADYFRTYTVSGYEARNIKVQAPAEPSRKPITIDAQEFPITDSGIQVQLDINNKASGTRKSPTEDLTSLLAQLESAVGSLKQDIKLEGLV